MKPLLVLAALALSGHALAAEPPAVYQQHCAACHGPERLGGSGPALLPENLGRLKPAEALRTIREGRPATQMPGFGAQFGEAELKSLVDYIYAPPATPPRWALEEIRASHVVHVKEAELPAKPVYQADMQNLFVVVEAGDHHATILDGDTFTPIHRFPTRYALHGGPKFTPDGRFVYFASRDGWVSRFDLYSLKVTAEIRVGLNTRNIAVSADGRYVLAGNYLPNSLVVLDARDLTPLELIPVAGRDGKVSRVSAVYTAPPRHSFVVALKDIPEIWEIAYSDKAPFLPITKGLVHDYKPESGEKLTIDTRRFPIRQIEVADYLDDFFFDNGYQHLIGASRAGGGQVVNLPVGRVVAKLDLPGMPHLGSGISFPYRGTLAIITPNLKEGALTVIDAQNWKILDRIETQGPGFFVRGHEHSRYIWSDVFMGPHKDLVHVIDRDTLKIVKTLNPAPGKTSGHIEFTRDGRYALLSIWEMDGAIVVYDARTLEEVKRIPMRKPVGKYNVYNKTHYEMGTSH